MEVWAMVNHWGERQGKPMSINRHSFCRHREDIIPTIFDRSVYHRMLAAEEAPDYRDNPTVADLVRWYSSRSYFWGQPIRLKRCK